MNIELLGSLVMLGIALPLAGLFALARWLVARFRAHSGPQAKASAQNSLRDQPSSADIEIERTVWRRAKRNALIALLIGAASALTLALLASRWLYPGWLASGLGQFLAIGPFIVATIGCLAFWLGEAFWPKPAGELRSATLARRTIWAIGGRWLWATIVATGLLIITVVVAGMLGDPTGRYLNTFTRPEWQGWRGPVWPGWYVGLPILLGLAALLGTVALAMRRILHRPPIAALPPTARGAVVDENLRRYTARQLLAWVLFIVTFLLGWIWRFVGEAIDVAYGYHHASGGLVSVNPAAVTLGNVIRVCGDGLVLLSVVLAAYCVSMLLPWGSDWATVTKAGAGVAVNRAELAGISQDELSRDAAQ